MPNIKDLYQDLTGVNIEQQRVLWDERGKGYYGEYLVFNEIYPSVTGTCKILMNLQIPTGRGRTTEIDLLLIHETGLYVFEVKHYKGTIYGKNTDQQWTQYFRTTPNAHFINPIVQNQYHINALQKLFPNVPIHSYIVFTNPECNLRIDNKDTEISIITLPQLQRECGEFRNKQPVLNINSIDSIFCELSAFSPMTAVPVIVNDEEWLLQQYLNSIIENFNKEKEKHKNAYAIQIKLEKKKTIVTIALAVITVALCFVFSAWTYVSLKLSSQEQVNAAQRELENFAQKFELVEDFNNGELSIKKGLVTASNVVLKDSEDLENAISFSCTLEWHGKNYGVSIGREAKLTVVLKDGSAKDYLVFNDRYTYTSDYLLGKSNNAYYLANTTGDILPHEFYEIAIDDISCIKLTNLDVWTDVQNTRKVIAEGFEIELYRAE